MKISLSLIAWEENQNLRETSHNVEFLRQVDRRYNLGEGQGVLYSNKKYDRFRIVANVGGVVMLVLPPVAAQRDLLLSLTLRVSIALREWKMLPSVRTSLNERFAA